MENNRHSLDFEKPLEALEKQLDILRKASADNQLDFSEEISAIIEKINATKRDIFSNLTSWQKVRLARHPARPYALDYINSIFEDFQELHGDRRFKDDQALIGGTAFFEGKPVMVIAQQKGRDTKENIRRNFGMPHPEGYRKALRLMEMAVRFRMPIITLVDTAGAYPGIGAEERHVSEAIAVNLREMAGFTVPIVVAIIGEGGSGGALGIAVGDRLLVMEYAYYSVISPEGCAAILWKDRSQAETAAEALKLGGRALLAQGIADKIIEEPLGGAHQNPELAAHSLKTGISESLAELESISPDLLLEQRYQKYRQMGPFLEV